MKPLHTPLTGLALAGAAGTVALSTAVDGIPSAQASPTGGALRSADPTWVSSGTGSSGLALHAGATLAPPKVLDLGSDPAGITQAVSDRDGAELSAG